MRKSRYSRSLFANASLKGAIVSNQLQPETEAILSQIGGGIPQQGGPIDILVISGLGKIDLRKETMREGFKRLGYRK